jgi:hypothetical protein
LLAMSSPSEIWCMLVAIEYQGGITRLGRTVCIVRIEETVLPNAGKKHEDIKPRWSFRFDRVGFAGQQSSDPERASSRPTTRCTRPHLLHSTRIRSGFLIDKTTMISISRVQFPTVASLGFSTGPSRRARPESHRQETPQPRRGQTRLDMFDCRPEAAQHAACAN